MTARIGSIRYFLSYLFCSQKQIGLKLWKRELNVATCCFWIWHHSFTLKWSQLFEIQHRAIKLVERERDYWAFSLFLDVATRLLDVATCFFSDVATCLLDVATKLYLISLLCSFSLIFFAIMMRNSSNSIDPDPSTSTSLIMSCKENVFVLFLTNIYLKRCQGSKVRKRW